MRPDAWLGIRGWVPGLLCARNDIHTVHRLGGVKWTVLDQKRSTRHGARVVQACTKFSQAEFKAPSAFISVVAMYLRKSDMATSVWVANVDATGLLVAHKEKK